MPTITKCWSGEKLGQQSIKNRKVATFLSRVSLSKVKKWKKNLFLLKIYPIHVLR